jgi:hypothetical protein
MQTYQLIEVNDKKTATEFLLLPIRLYRDEKNWVRPLDTDIESVFDPKRNKLFRHGECMRWILRDEKGDLIGRVAAFLDKKMAGSQEQPTGGMGFFECINVQQAANTLFDACRNWLSEKGMEAMDGPINFGDRDRWWGLLVDGFYPPNYCSNYNFPYYRELFEDYGFKNYFEQYTYQRPINLEGVDPVIMEKAVRIATNPKYSFKTLRKKESEKFAEHFMTIYNKAWARHSGVKPITKTHAVSLIKSMKPILDERLMWFAFYDDEPVAFYLMLPELNQIIKHLNGKMNMIGKIKFLYYKLTGKMTRAFGVIFGVVPEHQGKGVEAAIVIAFVENSFKPGFPYKELEMNWIGDFNPTMMRLAEQVGGKIYKTHITYRLLFDETKEFRRAGKI